METTSIYKCIFDGLHTGSVDKLVEAASKLLGIPLVVADATFVVLAKYPVEVVDDEQWDANVVNHQIRPEYIKIFQQDDHWSAYNARNNGAILIDWGFFDKSPRYSAQIVSQGKITGYVSALLGETKTEPDFKSWSQG